MDSGLPGPEHFDVVEEDVTPLSSPGSVTLSIKAFSADPYLRGQIKSTGSIKGGAKMSGFVVGEVVLSNGNAAWPVGSLFGASLPFSTVQTYDASDLAGKLIWNLTDKVTAETLTWGLGVLGMPGATAYGGLYDVLRPVVAVVDSSSDKKKEREVIFVSAASGAVGSLVGMLAKKVFGCVVIGSCGGPEKCKVLIEKFSFDHAIDYKDPDNAGKEGLVRALKGIAPGGINMYFENVGGEHFDAAFEVLANGGRIAVCGGISEYNNASVVGNVINPMKMIYTAQRIEGFVCMPWLTGKKGDFLNTMHALLQKGDLVVQETETVGIENWALAFQSLFTGANLGKVVVRV